jgi:hypothetical protein
MRQETLTQPQQAHTPAGLPPELPGHRPQHPYLAPYPAQPRHAGTAQNG